MSLPARMSVAEYRVYLATTALGSKARPAKGASKPQAGQAPSKTPGARRAKKFGNVETLVGDVHFDSSKEAGVYKELLLAMTASDPRARVVEIELQKRYMVIEKQIGERAAYYQSDFTVRYADGRTEVIDVKSAITRKHPVYVLKRKLMKSVHGISIIER